MMDICARTWAICPHRRSWLDRGLVPECRPPFARPGTHSDLNSLSHPRILAASLGTGLVWLHRAKCSEPRPKTARACQVATATSQLKSMRDGRTYTGEAKSWHLLHHPADGSPMATDASSLALEILTFEMGQSMPATSAQVAVGATEVWGKLARHFSRLLGERGMRTLLHRSVNLTTRTFPWFASVSSTIVNADAAVIELRDCLEQRDAQEAADGFVGLVGALIALLQRCIGHALVARLLREVWPQMVSSEVQELL